MESDALKILIAIPCMDTVPVDFMTSMINMRKTSETAYAVQANSMIYDSRNTLTAKALVNGYDRVLWIDSDMVFDEDLLERLNRDMDAGPDYVSALCFKRHIPTGPCVYREINYGQAEDGTVRAEAVPYNDYPEDMMFRCAGTGFGAVMVSTALLKDVWEHYGPPFNPLTQMGEDLSFCYRAAQLNYPMYCDSRIKVGHCGQYIYSESDYKREANPSG